MALLGCGLIEGIRSPPSTCLPAFVAGAEAPGPGDGTGRAHVAAGLRLAAAAAGLRGAECSSSVPCGSVDVVTVEGRNLTQFSCFSFSSSTPSCRMGPLMIRPSWKAPCVLWWEPLSFKLSMRFSRLCVLDLAVFSWPFMLKLKLDSSLGEGQAAEGVIVAYKGAGGADASGTG